MSAEQRVQSDSSRWSTRQLVTMALFCALATVLSFIEFPIFPAAPFLKYDASFVPIMVGGFAYGPGPGIIIGMVTALLHGIITGNIAGAIMNILVVVGYVLPAALIYRKIHRRRGAVIGLIVGSIVSIGMAILGNLVVTPIYTGTPLESIIAMILPILLPFNALKALINSLITLLCYKSISNLITPKKNQVEDVKGKVVPTYWNAEDEPAGQADGQIEGQTAAVAEGEGAEKAEEGTPAEELATVEDDERADGAERAEREAAAEDALSPEPAPPRESFDGDVLRFEHVSYTYDGTTDALHDVDFAIRGGDFFGLAGATGSGKSTLTLLMNGLNQASAGRVLFRELDLSEKENARSVPAHVGVVFQYPEYQLFASTVADDVAFGPCNLGLEPAEVKRRVARALDLVHLDRSLATKNPFELSGGQQRRAAIAGVLAMEPEVLVLDEPSAGLDPAGRKALFALLDELHAAGTTIVLVSHDMDDLYEHCNRLLILDHGEQRFLDDPHAIFTLENADSLRAIGLDLPRAVSAAGGLPTGEPAQDESEPGDSAPSEPAADAPVPSEPAADAPAQSEPAADAPAQSEVRNG